MCEASSYVRRWPIPFPMNGFPQPSSFAWRHGMSRIHPEARPHVRDNKFNIP